MKKAMPKYYLFMIPFRYQEKFSYFKFCLIRCSSYKEQQRMVPMKGRFVVTCGEVTWGEEEGKESTSGVVEESGVLECSVSFTGL
jgi:hypothetical protein